MEQGQPTVEGQGKGERKGMGKTYVIAGRELMEVCGRRGNEKSKRKKGGEVVREDEDAGKGE